MSQVKDIRLMAGLLSSPDKCVCQRIASVLEAPFRFGLDSNTTIFISRLPQILCARCTFSRIVLRQAPGRISDRPAVQLR